MGSNYIEMRLEDCMDAIIDYRGKTPKKVDNGIPLITAKIIKNGRIQEVSEFIAIDDYDNWMVRGLPLEGDVVLTTEAPLGEVAQLDARKVALAQRVITLRGKKRILENDYLLYLLQSSFVQNQLDGRASGSTVTGIKQSELREIILRLPPVALQKSISHQLKCLDKKIDLNNKINQTLEQMSQTLFKSWFVDFDPVIDNALDAGNPIPEALQSRAELRQKVCNSADFKPLPADIRALFPDEFEETELGWVPKGWILSDLGKEFNITMGQSPSGSTYNEDGIGLPFFQGKTDFGFRFPSKRIYCTEPKRLAKKFDTLLSVRAPVGVVNLASTECIIGRGLAALRHKSGNIAFTYYSVSNLSDYFSIFNGEGTVFGSINQKDLKQLPQICPPEKLINKFEEFSGKWETMVSVHCSEIESLSNLRDTLLPKLISGELSLEDLPNLVDQTEPA
ncbi:restriction endonuclease subunit S [Salmonella enterica]|nr:restriction endonuclease subunit S [Salmonella enterica subsp. salamae]EKN4989935.1 restriction endonuclease subunit S [Salmonella enterica]EKT4203709.1 restriction endonuclease subunit S [Salmonella enterica]